MADDLVGAAEVAQMLEVSRQRVHQLGQEYPDFPKPVARLARGHVWKRREIAAWDRKHGNRTTATRRR